jgi:hypothetical protein
MKRMLWITLFAALPATLLADEIKLKSGGRLEGLVKRQGGKLIVETLAGEITVNESDVESIDEKHKADIETYYEMRGQARTPADCLKLAAWAKERKAGRLVGPNVEAALSLARETIKEAAGFVELASPFRAALGADLRPLWERVLAIDPECEVARRELGFHLHGGKWLSEEEYQAALGNVRFEGRWMAAAERDTILKERAAKLEARIREVEARERKLTSAQDRFESDVRLFEEKAKKFEEARREMEKARKELLDREAKVSTKEKFYGELIQCPQYLGYYRVGTPHICPSAWHFCKQCDGWFKAGHKH